MEVIIHVARHTIIVELSKRNWPCIEIIMGVARHANRVRGR
jgi:hypothetical protein